MVEIFVVHAPTLNKKTPLSFIELVLHNRSSLALVQEVKFAYYREAMATISPDDGINIRKISITIVTIE